MSPLPPLPSGPACPTPPERTYSAFSLANHFVAAAEDTGIRTMGFHRLTLLTYAAHGITLALHDVPLLSEPVLATVDGPVIASLSLAARGGVVRGALQELNPATGGFEDAAPPPPSDVAAREILDAVWGRYHLSPDSGLAEELEFPWRICRVKDGFQSGAVLPDAYSNVYFTSLLARIMA